MAEYYWALPGLQKRWAKLPVLTWGSQLLIISSSGFLRHFDHSDDQVPMCCISMKTHEIVILSNKYSKQAGRHSGTCNSMTQNAQAGLMSWIYGILGITMKPSLKFKIQDMYKAEHSSMCLTCKKSTFQGHHPIT